MRRSRYGNALIAESSLIARHRLPRSSLQKMVVQTKEQEPEVMRVRGSARMLEAVTQAGSELNRLRIVQRTR